MAVTDFRNGSDSAQSLKKGIPRTMSAWELTPEARSFKVRRTVPANEIKDNVRSTSVHSPGSMVTWSAVIPSRTDCLRQRSPEFDCLLWPDLWTRIGEFMYVIDLAG